MMDSGGTKVVLEKWKAGMKFSTKNYKDSIKSFEERIKTLMTVESNSINFKITSISSEIFRFSLKTIKTRLLS